MLLTNRRHRILYVALAGMETAWMAPLVVLILRYWWQRLDVDLLRGRGLDALAQNSARMQTASPIVLFGFLFGAMLLYMLLADLLNQHQVDSPVHELIMAAMVLITSLVSVRLLLYAHLPITDLDWLRETSNAVFNFTEGRRPEIIILLLNSFLWWRVATNTDRDLSFFAVGVYFRLGLLLSVIGNATLAGSGRVTVADAFVYFALFMFWGLVAVSIARLDEKALLVEHSRGAVLPWLQVLQVAATAAITLALGGLLALVYRPGTILRVLGWFSPLWDALAAVAGALIFAVAWLLAPLMEATVRLLRWLFSQMDPIETPQQEQAFGEIVAVRPTDITALLERHDTVRYGLVVLMIVGILALIWLFFMRTRRRFVLDEEEEWAQERVSLGGGLLARGVDRLRNLFDLVRRYGLGTQLLAAISIQNIYANMSRIARSRGYPRPAAQPPDLYLPALMAAFPGCDDQLARITAAYMRVEYGDQALEDIELEALRRDYRHVRTTPLPETTDGDGAEAPAASFSA